MQLGFLIDHRRCIGCHACTVACKAENEVPVGSFRTWVKYTDKGAFPDVRRHFAVLRCNHCTKAPCVTICPVNALSKQNNGIVDLDRDACIGCRACMQACPYDALYLNEDRGSVEKCHFCAHRVEKQLEPACVIVCPEQAIVAGDLHDPNSKIARMVKEHETRVRRPEQNTGPNVHYLGVLTEALEPGLAERPTTYLWSDRPDTKPEEWPKDVPTAPHVTTTLDAGHQVQWGEAVALYLVTKGIAAGAALMAPLVAALGVRGFAGDYLPEILALVFLGVTLFLLIEDLTRPLAFIRLLTRPNPKSWLVKGGWILSAFGATVSAALALRWLGFAAAADALRFVNAVLALGVAGYTAFLFQQCEGRDLWQTKTLLWQLLAQALFLGALSLMPFAERAPIAAWIAWAGLLVHTALAMRERRHQHPTANARQAAGFLSRVRWNGVPAFATGLVLCFVALVGAFPLASIAPWLILACAVIGLFLHEVAFVRAGQLPTLS